MKRRLQNSAALLLLLALTFAYLHDLTHIHHEHDAAETSTVHTGHDDLQDSEDHHDDCCMNCPLTYQMIPISTAPVMAPLAVSDHIQDSLLSPVYPGPEEIDHPPRAA